MEIKSIEQIKEEVAKEHGFRDFAMMYYDEEVEIPISEVAERYAQQYQDQAPTDILTTEIMVLRERNDELVEMLERAKSMIGKLRRSMFVHPNCTIGSEFDDRTTDAQNLEDEIESLINLNIN